MYNPFRPHIIKQGESFYVRKFSLKYMSYLYLDAKYYPNYWWLEGNMEQGKFSSLERAKKYSTDTASSNFVTYT